MLGQQLEVEGEGNENVPLYYYITDKIRIQFRREEFCMVTGLRFGVENLAYYNDRELPIPFRRRVFPSCYDGEHITSYTILEIIKDEVFDRLHDEDVVSLCCLGILQLILLGVEAKCRIPDWMLRLANDKVGWDNYPWGSFVWPTLYSQLKIVNVKRWPKLYATQPINEIDKKAYSIFGYTWAFKTCILESFRVTATKYYYRYNRYPRVAAWKKKKGKFMGSMVHDFFHGNLPGARLTPDKTEARSNWWISSRKYFDGGIGQTERLPRHLNRQNMYEVPSELYRQFEEQKRAIEEPKRVIEEIKKTKMIGGPSSFQTHPNSSSFFNIGTPTNWQTPMSSQPGPSNWQSQMPAQSATSYWQPAFPSHPGGYNWQSPIPSHIGDPNLQPLIERHHDAAGLFNQNILNRGKREQRPSFYKRTPYTEQPPTTILPKQRGNKNKTNVMNANLSPLNLGNAFDDENEGGDDVIFLGSEFTGNYLVYENVDPQKVKREHYVTVQEFLNDPKQIYLDCYMKGYLVPVTFWQQLVPHLCMPDIDSRTLMGWLSGEVAFDLLRDALSAIFGLSKLKVVTQIEVLDKFPRGWLGLVRHYVKQLRVIIVGKLNPKCVGPSKVMETGGSIAYKLERPQELSRIHNTFQVSNLRKCYANEPLGVPLDELYFDNELQVIEEPIEIMDREVKRLRQSRVPLVKVRWNSRRGPEFTWEREDQFKKKYPHLFSKAALVSSAAS
ncbi:phospholipase-like protein [Tanacetum coccineum]